MGSDTSKQLDLEYLDHIFGNVVTYNEGNKGKKTTKINGKIVSVTDIIDEHPYSAQEIKEYITSNHQVLVDHIKADNVCEFKSYMNNTFEPDIRNYVLTTDNAQVYIDYFINMVFIWTISQNAPQCTKYAFDKYQICKTRNINMVSVGINIKCRPAAAAITYDRVEALEFLLDNGVEINHLNHNGNTPLAWSIIRKSPNCFNLLIKRGANVNVLSNKWGNPLHIACLRKQTEMARVLIKKGVDIDAKQSKSGATPLVIAVAKNDIDTVKLLVRKGADINIMFTKLETSLTMAIVSGHYKIVKYLARHGADLNKIIMCFAAGYGSKEDHENFQHVMKKYGHIFEEYKRKKIEEEVTAKVKKEILDELYAPPNGLLYKARIEEVWRECESADVEL